MSPGSANSDEQLHVDDADLGRLAGLFELLQQLVDLFQLLLDGQRLRHGHRLVAGELVLGGQLVDLVLVAQPLDHAAPARRPTATGRRRPRTTAAPVANLLGLHRLVKRLAKLLGHLSLRWPDRRTPAGPRLRRTVSRFVAGQNLPLPLLRASRSARRCSARVRRSGWDRAGSPGPAPPRSARDARRTSSMCSSAGDTKSGGGCVGLGNRAGSYRWYVWMTPPSVSRLAMRESRAEGRESRARAIRSYKRWRNYTLRSNSKID